VDALDCDALVCSGYKWFGPHQSILWARPELLEWLEPDKLRPSPDTVPERWEFGTPAFESLAGLSAAARYVIDLGYDEIRAHEECCSPGSSKASNRSTASPCTAGRATACPR